MPAALQDLGAEPEDISRVPAPAAVAALMALARRSVAMRHWEREHLPIHASQLGFELFMTLPLLFTAGWRDRTGLLKQLYLMLPYSEKGVRLHLRRLETAGWVTVAKTAATRGRRSLSSAWAIGECWACTPRTAS